VSRSARSGRQDGSVLVWALFFVSLTTGILIAHSIELSANRRQLDTRYRRVDLANTIAESGLTDATAYLRRQAVQPVTAFAPQLDLGADPPVNETLDPSLGLVREFEVKGNLWGRYEVRSSEAKDISASYGEAAGRVWDVGARGYLFERRDASRPFDEAPNHVISSQTVCTELRGVPLRLPSTSSILVTFPTQVEMLGNATVDGRTGPAVGYKKPFGPAPLPIFDVAITGTPIGQPILGLNLAMDRVVGMREDRLRNLADVTLTSPNQLRGRVVQDEIVYVPGDLLLDASALSLRGRMLLVVGGNLLASANNNSDFRGVMFVKGWATLEGPFAFAGTMIAGGQIKVGGTADMVRVQSSPLDVSGLQAALARYRISKDRRPGGGGGTYVNWSDLQSAWR
jgi:hypothetical protein